MTMPNGSTPPQFAPGMHVQPGPMSYVVGTRMIGTQKIVVLHVEHTTGSSVLPMDPATAKAIADALIKASTGLEIARGNVNPPG